MKRRVVMLMAVSILALGTTAWAAGVDFSGNWAVAGAANGMTLSIHQHGDAFRIVAENAEGGSFRVHFVANGQQQQLRARGTMQRIVQASWQGDELLMEGQVLSNSKVHRRISLRISMAEDGNLHVEMTRGFGQHARTSNLVLVRQ